MRIVCGSSLKSRQRPSGPHKAMARGIDGRLTVLLDKLEFELTNGGFGAEKDTAGGHAVEGRDRRGRLPITESWFEVMSGYYSAMGFVPNKKGPTWTVVPSSTSPSNLCHRSSHTES